MAERLRPKHYKKIPKTLHCVWRNMKTRCFNQNSPGMRIQSYGWSVERALYGN